MSKQSEAKHKQGYIPKALPRTCCNCVHFRKDSKTLTEYGCSWTRDTNLRCSISGFAVKKMATCNEWSNTVPAPPRSTDQP